MQVFKTSEFVRLANKEGLADEDCCEAVDRAEKGLVYAALGKFLIKQRAGGVRTIIFHQEGHRAVLLHVFAKNAKENLSKRELEIYRDFAKELAQVTATQVEELVKRKKWVKIDYEQHCKNLSKRTASIAASRGEGSSRGRRDR
jgi:hypothetical protein